MALRGVCLVGCLAAASAASKPTLRVESVHAVDNCRGQRVKKGDVVHINHMGFVEDDGQRRQIDANCPPDAPECEPLSFRMTRISSYGIAGVRTE